MGRGRWRGGVAALATAVTTAGVVAGGVVATAAPPAAADEPQLRVVTWICYVDESGDDQFRTDGSVETANGRTVLLLDGVVCTNTVEEDGARPQLDLSYFRSRFPGLAAFQDGTIPDWVVLVQCGDRGATLGAASAGSRPTAGELRRDCLLEVPEGARTGGGGGPLGGMDGDFGGGLLWGAGDGMPSADSLDCGGGSVANPWAAEGSGGGSGPSNGALAWKMFKQFVQGVAIGYGTSKGLATGGTGGIVSGAGGAVGIEAWGLGVADSLSKDLTARYQDYTASLAQQALDLAGQALEDAEATAAAAPGSAEDVAASEAAKLAAIAAKAAAKAAETARNSTDRGEIGAAYRAALKAAEEAKKQADAARKARTSSGAAPPTDGTPSPGGSPANQACEELRQQMQECEQNGWKTSDCQNLANLIKGCQVDMTVALVGEDGQVCGQPYLDPDVVRAALERACGLEIAHYGPDSDPCGQYVDGLGPLMHDGDCDPTVAFGGCPDGSEQTGTLPDKGVVCIDAPSKLPPLPCFDTGTNPTVDYVIDGAGTLLVPGLGGVLAVGNVDMDRMPPYRITP